jgi:hypothetical protein
VRWRGSPQCDKDKPPNSFGGQRLDYRRTEAEAQINHAIDLIMEYNQASGRNHQDKFRIGMGALRKMTKRGCRVIERIIESRNDEIEKHQLLNPRHNNKGFNAISIDAAIPLD